MPDYARIAYETAHAETLRQGRRSGDTTPITRWEDLDTASHAVWQAVADAVLEAQQLESRREEDECPSAPR